MIKSRSLLMKKITETDINLLYVLLFTQITIKLHARFDDSFSNLLQK